MERTIFPLKGSFNDKGLLMDIWSSGMITILSPEDPGYAEALSMAENPPDQLSDEEIWGWFNASSGRMDEFWEALDPYERERLGAMLEKLREEENENPTGI